MLNVITITSVRTRVNKISFRPFIDPLSPTSRAVWFDGISGIVGIWSEQEVPGWLGCASVSNMGDGMMQWLTFSGTKKIPSRREIRFLFESV